MPAGWPIRSTNSYRQSVESAFPVAANAVQRPQASRCSVHSFWKLVAKSCCLLVLLSIGAGCGKPRREVVTVTLLDTGPLPAKGFYAWREKALRQFTKQTGIAVKALPAFLENTSDQLEFSRKLLESDGADTPDVYSIDVIWPGELAEYFTDLNPYLAQDAKKYFPALVANNTVDGKLLAMPYYVDVGLLFYRTDLLAEYGFREPPATWEALDKMAAKIQAGERAKGNKNFWGYVWNGAATEGLTCGALEWQASEGGGPIIDDNRTITVNNPHTVRAWQRAARWIGVISPPALVAYDEWDAQNIWELGNVAFMRNWPPTIYTSEAAGSAVVRKFNVTFLPRGQAGRAHTLGGYGLSISRYSHHRDEAVALVRFLTSPEIQRWRSRETSLAPTIPDLYDDPELLRANPHYPQLKAILEREMIARPSGVTGKKYSAVSKAYYDAVHSVLTGNRNAREAAANLEKELVRITGFQARAATSSVHAQ